MQTMQPGPGISRQPCDRLEHSLTSRKGQTGPWEHALIRTADKPTPMAVISQNPLLSQKALNLRTSGDRRAIRIYGNPTPDPNEKKRPPNSAPAAIVFRPPAELQEPNAAAIRPQYQRGPSQHAARLQ